jgi:hypothetical protein
MLVYYAAEIRITGIMRALLDALCRRQQPNFAPREAGKADNYIGNTLHYIANFKYEESTPRYTHYHLPCFPQ